MVGPIEVLGADDWRRQFEVNVIGQVALTRALLPALFRARGRVVNVSSIGYLVGRDARLQARLNWLLPDRAMDALIRRAMK